MDNFFVFFFLILFLLLSCFWGVSLVIDYINPCLFDHFFCSDFFCPLCGTQVHELPLVCPSCGHTEKSDFDFCRECGGSYNGN